MKKLTALFLSLLLISGTVSVSAASIWTKYVAADKSYSFHFPSGWKVIADESYVDVENSKTDEQLIMSMLPFDQQMSAEELAVEFIDFLKSENPNIRGYDMQSIATADYEQVIFNLSDKVNSKKYSGLGMVIKSEEQAVWLSYFAPSANYYQIRGYNILQGFIGSLASGSASKAPKNIYNADVAGRIDKNAKAFMFVLEFSLGAPLTKSQEDKILSELKAGWRFLSEEELKVYDQYPTLVKTILKIKQKDLEELRAELEDTISEWLEEADPSDQAVKIINSTMKGRGKIVIDGEPPLTDMSLTAYSEMIAYSRLLQKDPKAKPDKISQKSVNEIKKQVKAVWDTFSETDKKDIATTPGLWVCLRAQLQYGTKDEQEEIREYLKNLDAAAQNTDSGSSPAEDNASGSETEEPMDMTTHWCMMQMNQMTFNSYMWSQGFNYSPVYGKMW